MTNKRFIIIDGIKRGTHSHVWDKQKQNNQRIGDELWLGEVVDLLNSLNEENEQLKKEKESLIKGIKDTAKQGADTITAVWESKNRPTTMNKGYYDR